MLCKASLCHDQATCFELVGYPPGWTIRGGRGGIGRNRGGRGGGRSSDGGGCGREAMNVAEVHVESGAGAKENYSTPKTRFTPEQVQRLISLIETPKSGYKKLLGTQNWLLDLGALCHMIGFFGELFDVCNLESVLIELPNGSLTMATKQGSIQLNSNLKLHHVLYVSGLNCSLIFSAQLIEENACDVTFTKELCVIQDLISSSSIRMGEPRRWVYYLQNSSLTSIQVNKVYILQAKLCLSSLVIVILELTMIYVMCA